MYKTLLVPVDQRERSMRSLEIAVALASSFDAHLTGLYVRPRPQLLADVRERYLPCRAPLRQGSYRGLAATANTFARESIMEELASAAGIDSLAFRLAHLKEPRLRDVLLKAAERFRYRERVQELAPRNGKRASGTG